jgi:hypothetical protein
MVTMMREIKKFVIVMVLSCAVLVGVWSAIAFAQTSTPTAAQPQIESTIPAALAPCFPQSIDRIELLGQVQKEAEQFYLLGAGAGDRYWELLIQTTDSGCLLIKGQRDTESLSAYVPVEIAQQLTLQRYQRRIKEAGGLATFQQGFTAYMTQQQGGELVYLAPENVWALQQLGVQIPEGTYQIRQPRTAPQGGS